jgi:hypothetical protein
VKAPDLVHAYVKLDRLVFFRLQITSLFESCCAQIKQRLGENDGLGDFEKLCELGAESHELLWLLRSCEGLPGCKSAAELFGWSAKELNKSLFVMEHAASVIEKMQRHPFGLLARNASVDGKELYKSLRSYLALARAAQGDFGRGSYWFLNVAKARLVIHVSHKIKGHFRDKEVSGLIAAMTDTAYNAAAQSQWRHTHEDLIQDPSLDPYTTMGEAERAQVRANWEYIASQAAEFFECFEAWAADHEALIRWRGNKQTKLRKR